MLAVAEQLAAKPRRGAPPAPAHLIYHTPQLCDNSQVYKAVVHGAPNTPPAQPANRIIIITFFPLCSVTAHHLAAADLFTNQPKRQAAAPLLCRWVVSGSRSQGLPADMSILLALWCCR